MGVFRFALRPDFLGARRIILVRKDEIEAAGRLALVTNIHFKFLAEFRRLSKIDVKLVIAKLVRGVLAVDARAGNGEIRAIKIQMRQTVVQCGKCVRYFTDDLALIQIEMQRHAYVLQVVFAAGRIGPVGACSHGEHRSQRKENSRDARAHLKLNPGRIHSCLTKRFASYGAT